MGAGILNGGLQERVGTDAGRAGDGAQPRPAAASALRKPKSKWRAWYLKQLHTWHWVSAAVSLIGMLLFAITGLTLNHSASIGADPKVTQGSGTLPHALLAQLKATPKDPAAPLPDAVADQVLQAVRLDPHGKPAEWSEDEVYVAMPGPGSDAWVSIDRASGALTSEKTDRGWISYLNDLHKGRNSGSTWFWFIDAFAAACIIFTLSGLLLLQLHAKNRPSTWPLAALGLLIPVIIAILFIH